MYALKVSLLPVASARYHSTTRKPSSYTKPMEQLLAVRTSDAERLKFKSRVDLVPPTRHEDDASVYSVFPAGGRISGTQNPYSDTPAKHIRGTK